MTKNTQTNAQAGDEGAGAQTNAQAGDEGAGAQTNAQAGAQGSAGADAEGAANKKGSAEARVLLAYSDKSGDYQPNDLIKASKTAIEKLVKQGVVDDSKEAVKYAKSLVKAAQE